MKIWGCKSAKIQKSVKISATHIFVTKGDLNRHLSIFRKSISSFIIFFTNFQDLVFCGYTINIDLFPSQYALAKYNCDVCDDNLQIHMI